MHEHLVVLCSILLISNLISFGGTMPLIGLLGQILIGYLLLLNEIFFFESRLPVSIVYTGVVAIVCVTFISNTYMYFPQFIRLAVIVVVIAELYFWYVWVELKRLNR